MVSAIILAGGDSSRMGSPKALLADREGRPFVLRIADSMRAAGLTDVVVVTGRHHDAIGEVIERSGAGAALRIARNDAPSRGQLSSLWTGLEACPPETEAVAVTLVDVPFVSVATIAEVVRVWSHAHAPIVRPSFEGRRGHPVMFDRALFDEIRRAPLDVGARAVGRAHDAEIVNVPVDDPNCLVDVDTPADYERVVRPRPG
jgi:molybdenum cofactor cytidylyltransferase